MFRLLPQATDGKSRNVENDQIPEHGGVTQNRLWNSSPGHVPRPQYLLLVLDPVRLPQGPEQGVQGSHSIQPNRDISLTVVFSIKLQA